MPTFKPLPLIVLALTALAPSGSFGASIQMLPPTQLVRSENGSLVQRSCNSGQGNKLLTWDGANPIRCQETVTVDNSSLIIKPQLFTNEGAQLVMEGAAVNGFGVPRYDNWYPDVYQYTLRFLTNSANTNQVQIFNNGAGEAGLYVEGTVGAGVVSPQAKLDVAGGIKIANDGAACTAAKAGTIRWSGAAMEFCDGVIWKGLGDAGPTNPTECGEGTLVQWDNATKTSTCKPIYSAMTCVTKTASAFQDVALNCDPGYYVVAGSCWRTEGSGGVGGLFIGDRVSKTEYRCRIEGAAATNIFVTCCK